MGWVRLCSLQPTEVAISVPRAVLLGQRDRDVTAAVAVQRALQHAAAHLVRVRVGRVRVRGRVRGRVRVRGRGRVRVRVRGRGRGRGRGRARIRVRVAVLFSLFLRRCASSQMSRSHWCCPLRRR